MTAAKHLRVSEISRSKSPPIDQHTANFSPASIHEQKRFQ